MKEKPIIFSAPMVRAILDGRKTQTRRVLKPQPVGPMGSGQWFPGPPGHKHNAKHYANEAHFRRGCPLDFAPYQPGDLLWVREAFRLRADQDRKPPSQDPWKAGAWHEADGPHEPSGCAGGAGKLRSPIHMPRWASRITLRVTGVRVQRVSEITYEDMRDEGTVCSIHGTTRHVSCAGLRKGWVDLWNSIHAKHPERQWVANPWVAAISFQRVEP